MPGVHAKSFSPSSSCKWLNCPGSVLLEEEFPYIETDYAREGTLAHAIAEHKIKKHFTPMSQKDFTSQMNELKKDPLYQNEMQGYTDMYLDYIKEAAMQFHSAPFVTVEKKVSFERYAPGGYGTSDCIIIGANTMYVCDFKYGKGVKVDAEKNTQGMIYALGALNAYEMFYQIDEIVIAIIQPRIDNISEYRITANDLIKWADEYLKPAVQKILNGVTECNPGPWCDKGFCKARGKCEALAKKNLALADDYGLLPPGELSFESIGEALTKGRQLKTWLTALEEYALSKSLAGCEIPGWKAVAGRSVRQFTDTDKAFEHFIENGVKKDMLYKRVPVTLTEAEKLIGKKEFAKMAKDFIVKSEPKPTLAESSDKREVYKPNNAANDFAGII